MSLHWKNLACLFLTGFSLNGSLLAQADSSSLDIDIDRSSSVLQSTITPSELLGNPSSDADFRILGSVDISSNLKNHLIYAYLNKTTLPLTRGSSQILVSLNGTIGSYPISVLPMPLLFVGNHAQINITGNIMPGQLNTYLQPGTYTGTLVITAVTL